MENKQNEEKTVIECLPGLLTLYSDGSFQRHTPSLVPACSSFRGGLATADITIDPALGVWARVFMPQPPSNNSSISTTYDTKLPVVLYFHGGGFCIGSPAVSLFHDFCSRMAIRSQCIWISVQYRLAPEHPLPAAYEDAYTALLWLRAQASLQLSDETLDMPVKNPVEAPAIAPPTSICTAAEGGDETSALQWLNQYADFSNVFIAGESAGGAISHFAAARASTEGDSKPLHIRALLVIHPAFFMEKPMEAQDGETKPGIPLTMARIEFYYRAAVSKAAEWGHPLANPMHPQAPLKLSEIELPAVLVAVASHDLVRLGGEQYYEALKKAGKPDVHLLFSEGFGHAYHLLSDLYFDAASEFEDKLIKFMQDHTSSS